MQRKILEENTILLTNAKRFFEKKNPSFIKISYVLRERMIIRKIRYKNWTKLPFSPLSVSHPSLSHWHGLLFRRARQQGFSYQVVRPGSIVKEIQS